MAETIPYEHPEHHEHSDVRIRPLIWIGVIFVVFAIVTHLGLWLLFGAFEGAAKAENEAVRLTELTPLAPRVRAGVPKLQGVPPLHANTAAQDTAEMKARNHRLLQSYGRTETGSATIPIERAMELSLQRGMFPTAAATQPAEGRQ